MAEYQLHAPTIENIKRLAKRIKKAEGIQHSKALDAAAVKYGFQNFRHASKSLKGVV